MRLFCNQTNDVWTDPILQPDGDIELNAVATSKYFEADESVDPPVPTANMVPSSNITLNHIGGGVHRGTTPEIAVVNGRTYFLEIQVHVSGVRVWYAMMPIKARMRDQNTNEP